MISLYPHLWNSPYHFKGEPPCRSRVLVLPLRVGLPLVGTLLLGDALPAVQEEFPRKLRWFPRRSREFIWLFHGEITVFYGIYHGFLWDFYEPRWGYMGFVMVYRDLPWNYMSVFVGFLWDEDFLCEHGNVEVNTTFRCALGSTKKTAEFGMSTELVGKCRQILWVP